MKPCLLITFLINFWVLPQHLLHNYCYIHQFLFDRILCLHFLNYYYFFFCLALLSVCCFPQTNPFFVKTKAILMSIPKKVRNEDTVRTRGKKRIKVKMFDLVFRDVCFLCSLPCWWNVHFYILFYDIIKMIFWKYFVFLLIINVLVLFY